MHIHDAQQQWTVEPGWLNTASFGLPPRSAFEALQAALNDWQVGRTSWEGWAASVSVARTRYAAIIGVEESDVAVGAQVSQMLAPVAAAVPDGSTVLVPDIEFTSAVFPWAVHTDRGITVRTAPVVTFAEHIDESIDVVCFSIVQSATGEIMNYHAITEAARSANALVVVDATQACGWYPFDGRQADVVVNSAYKWLLAPRGTGFVYLAPELRERLKPIMAGWFAGEDTHDTFYGLPLRLARNARAFDLSPAWHPWVGTGPALQVVQDVGVEAINRHNVRLANRFLTGLGYPPGASAIVTVSIPGAQDRLAAAGVKAAVRDGRVRASFHLYTTDHDVDLALNALTGTVPRTVFRPDTPD